MECTEERHDQLLQTQASDLRRSLDFSS